MDPNYCFLVPLLKLDFNAYRSILIAIRWFGTVTDQVRLACKTFMVQPVNEFMKLYIHLDNPRYFYWNQITLTLRIYDHILHQKHVFTWKYKPEVERFSIFSTRTDVVTQQEVIARREFFTRQEFFTKLYALLDCCGRRMVN